MSASHLLVLSSIIYSLILGLFFIFYTFVYPKKKIPLFILTILITCLPLLSILRAGSYESGDLSLHATESISFYHLLSQGDFFPIWGGESNATYGYPSFLFTYPLPFYIIAFFHFIGFSFLNSVKLLLISSYLLASVFMFKFLVKEFNEKSAFFGTIAYMFAPYYFVDLHFRVDIGEVVAFTFLPLSLYAFIHLLSSGKKRWFLLEIIAFAGLILSHPAISIIGIPVILVYILLFMINKKIKIHMYFLQLMILFIAGMLTAFYWFPLISELKYTHQDVQSQTLVFLTLKSLLYAPSFYGFLFQDSHGHLAYLVGYPQICIILSSLFLLMKSKIEKNSRNILLISLVLVFVFSFLMLEISKPLWYIIPFLHSFQFSSRILGVVIFIVGIISAIWVKHIKNKWIIIFFSLFIIFSTLLNWGNRRNIPEITDSVLARTIAFQAKNGGGLSQALTIWSDPFHPWAETIPAKHLQVLHGDAKIVELHRDNKEHTYIVQVKKNTQFRENTLYFPGWNLSINGQPKPITILNTEKPKGIISFSLPQGIYEVKLLFLDTNYVVIGRGISIITLLGLIIGSFLYKQKLAIQKPYKKRK